MIIYGIQYAKPQQPICHLRRGPQFKLQSNRFDGRLDNVVYAPEARVTQKTQTHARTSRPRNRTMECSCFALIYTWSASFGNTFYRTSNTSHPNQSIQWKYLAVIRLTMTQTPMDADPISVSCHPRSVSIIVLLNRLKMRWLCISISSFTSTAKQFYLHLALVSKWNRYHFTADALLFNASTMHEFQCIQYLYFEKEKRKKNEELNSMVGLLPRVEYVCDTIWEWHSLIFRSTMARVTSECKLSEYFSIKKKHVFLRVWVCVMCLPVNNWKYAQLIYRLSAFAVHAPTVCGALYFMAI